MGTYQPDDWETSEGGRQYTAHVAPVGDLIEHDTSSDGGCVCGPSTIPVETAHGGFGWVLQHHALDAREFSEGTSSDGA